MSNKVSTWTFAVFSVVLLTAAAVSSWYNHTITSAQQAQLVKMLTDPTARPDAWTKTMDDRRTIKLCDAIINAASPGQQPLTIEILPEVCK